MKSKIVRFVLIATFLVAASVIGCQQSAEDVCTEEMTQQNPPATCEIDMGCGEDPIAGTCEMVGTINPVATCVPN